MLTAVIFDMDGVLIDSEPLWQDEERRIFAELGLTLTRQMQEATFGLAPKEMIEHWYTYKPWKSPAVDEIKEQLLTRVTRRILDECEALPGVHTIIDFFKEKKLMIGLASSSPINLIKPALMKLGIEKKFDVLCTAEEEGFAKPHPAVYIAAYRKLNMHPSRCLAVEDSFNGLLSAKSARLKVLAVPDEMHFENHVFDIADVKLRSLEEFTEAHFEYLNNIN